MRPRILALCLLVACRGGPPKIAGTYPNMSAGTAVDFLIGGAFGLMNGQDARVVFSRTRDLTGRSLSDQPQTVATGKLLNAPLQQLTIKLTLRSTS
jgi:hypothetical protein